MQQAPGAAVHLAKLLNSKEASIRFAFELADLLRREECADPAVRKLAVAALLSKAPFPVVMTASTR